MATYFVKERQVRICVYAVEADSEEQARAEAKERGIDDFDEFEIESSEIVDIELIEDE